MRTLKTHLRATPLEARDVPSAALQVIHNSPYAAAAKVDVYANGQLLINDLAYKSARSFGGLPAGTYTIDITAADAPDNAHPVFSTTITLSDDTRYIATAAGDPVAPAGSATAFDLEVFAPARTTAPAGQTALLAFHGAPDAPTVSVRARGVATLVPAFSFRDYAGYVTVPSADYTVDVALTNGAIVRSFAAPLSGLGGQAVTVLATGFVHPPAGSANSFGLLAVLADGTTVELPVNTTVDGTDRSDRILVSESQGVVSVSVNWDTLKFLAATNPALTIKGLGGNDTILAGGVCGIRLTIDGGAGNDRIVGSQSGATLIGGSGNDVIWGGAGNDRIDGGAGNDLLYGGPGNDTIRGGTGNDVLVGGPGLDDLDGQKGRDLTICW